MLIFSWDFQQREEYPLGFSLLNVKCWIRAYEKFTTWCLLKGVFYLSKLLLQNVGCVLVKNSFSNSPKKKYQSSFMKSEFCFRLSHYAPYMFSAVFALAIT